MIRLRQLTAELRRRKVFRTTGLYLIAAWVVLQVADVTFVPLGVPHWVNTLLIWAAIIGFPVTVALGWRYELGPDGLALTRQRTGADDAKDTSLQRTDYLILTLVVIVVGAASYGLVARFSAIGEQDSRSVALNNTVAVLPFVNMSTDPGDASLGDGLSEELRDQLGLVEGIGVVARGSSIVFRNQDVDVRRISDDLGAAFLVMGRVTTAVVSVELVEGPSGIRVWSRPFERRTQGLLAIQRAVLAEVVARIAPGTETSTVLATSDVSAHEVLLLARQLDQDVRDDLVIDETKRQRAIELYRSAIALDPGSALAHSRLGALLLYGGDVDSAVIELDRALALDSRLSEAHYTRAIYLTRRHLSGVKAAYERAAELGPNNAEVLSAYAQWIWGHEDARDAGDLFRRALELDPLSLVRFRDYAEYLASMSRKGDVLELAERIRTRFPNARGYLALARVHELVGEVDVGIAWALKALEAPDLSPVDDAPGAVAELYAQIGDFEVARAYEPDPGVGQLFWQRRYPELIDLAQDRILEGESELRVFYLLGFAYSAMEQFADAVDLLEYLGVADIEPESRLSADTEATITLIDASYALGDKAEVAAKVEEMLDNLQWHLDTGMRDYWWPNVLYACVVAVLGRDAEALDALERVNNSLALPQTALLQDFHCFQRFQNEPRYRAVLANLEHRKKLLRDRLPQTLRDHGVVALSN